MITASRLEHWEIGRLTGYEFNARTHSDEQVTQIAKSITAFGFTNPILAGDDGVIIAGHGRLAAAKQLGLEVVPVIVLDHLSDAERRALVLADNKIAMNAGWDEELLAMELADLRELDFDLDLTGFSLGELDELFSPAEATKRPQKQANLADRFMLPPFTVLNAREGWWNDRKRAWLALGIKSELGRGDTLVYGGQLKPGSQLYGKR